MELNISLEEDEFASRVSPEMDITVGVYMALIGVFALVLNGGVLWIGVSRKQAMSPPEWFLVSLAASDLCISQIGYPIVVFASFNHRWMGGYTSCTAYGFVGFFSGLSSITCGAVMAVVRCMKVCFPQSKGHLVTERFVLRCLVFVYGYAFVWSVLPLVGWGEYALEPHRLSCTIGWTTPSARSYVTAVFVCCVFLPVVVIIGSYVFITLTTIRRNRLLQYGRHMTKMTVMISVGFLIAWMPYASVSLLTVWVSEDIVSPTLSLLPVMFAKSSAVYNPLIYFFMSSTFRAEVAHVLRRCCGLERGERRQSGGTACTRGSSPIAQHIGVFAEEEMLPVPTSEKHQQTDRPTATMAATTTAMMTATMTATMTGQPLQETVGFLDCNPGYRDTEHA